MSAEFEIASPLPGAQFGATVQLKKSLAQTMPAGLPAALADAGGLLLIPDLHEIASQPELLVDLSRQFGPEVEDYRYTLTSARMSVHTDDAGDLPGHQHGAGNYRAPPKRPEPPLTADGRLPVQYPHRKGWHTYQSYRRPPPGHLACSYAVNAGRPRARSDPVCRLHRRLRTHCRLASRRGSMDCRACTAQPGTGRGREADAEAGKTPRRFAPHERSQPQPVVRIHPGDRQEGALPLRARPDGLVSTVPSSACSPDRTAMAPALLDELMSPLTRGRSSSMSTNGPRATCWCGTTAASSIPRPGTTPTRSSA